MIPQVTVQELLDRQSAGKRISRLFANGVGIRVEYEDGEVVHTDDLAVGENGDRTCNLASLISTDRGLPMKETQDYLSSVTPDIKTGMIWLPETGFWD